MYTTYFYLLNDCLNIIVQFLQLNNPLILIRREYEVKHNHNQLIIIVLCWSCNKDVRTSVSTYIRHSLKNCFLKPKYITFIKQTYKNNVFIKSAVFKGILVCTLVLQIKTL